VGACLAVVPSAVPSEVEHLAGVARPVTACPAAAAACLPAAAACPAAAAACPPAVAAYPSSVARRAEVVPCLMLACHVAVPFLLEALAELPLQVVPSPRERVVAEHPLAALAAIGVVACLRSAVLVARRLPGTREGLEAVEVASHRLGAHVAA